MNTILAYIDPGSGSLFFQLLIAGVAGALLTFKTQMGLIKVWIKTRFGKKGE
jgi:hypothetical protein